MIALTLAVVSPPLTVNACRGGGLLNNTLTTLTERTYKDGCKTLTIVRYEQGKITYKFKVHLCPHRKKGKHILKRERGIGMTDVKRLNHLFSILAKMQKKHKGDVWGDFVRLYKPTQSEEKKLKALYESYFVNETLKISVY